MTILLNINELKGLINKGDTGILFCFGTSFISKMIQLKTRLNDEEIVPSHVAMIVDGSFLYESTSMPDKLSTKTIPAGVRRYKLQDFYRIEKGKSTKYYFLPYDNIDMDKLETYVHYPYGKDTILDFILKDGSDGVSKGLICSQYANRVTGLLEQDCPSPAVMYRKALTFEEQLDNSIKEEE